MGTTDRQARRARRHRRYFWLMGTCVALILLAWNLVRLWSVPLAVAMTLVAAAIPPVAAFVGNSGIVSGAGDDDPFTYPDSDPESEDR